MGRLLRPVEDGFVYHALNRGNNRADVFTEDADRNAFLGALAKTQTRYPFRLFGYCLMTNHFHLLLRPEPEQSISRILQSLTIAHTWHHHKRRRTVGHVWQGRFKSPVVQDDDHLFVVLRYIEANPLRAAMVAGLNDYPWSSYMAHGLGHPDPLLSPLPEWNRLGDTEPRRQARWQLQVASPQEETELSAIRASVRTGRPLGTASWVETAAANLRIDLNHRPRGRPRKVRERGKGVS
jgi:putative transposase